LRLTRRPPRSPPLPYTPLFRSRARAVLVVHYQGAAADMTPIVQAAHRHGMFVIEDCAEAPGASYRGRRVGTWSDVAIFSFQHNRSEEHTSELQSREKLVCRLLL